MIIASKKRKENIAEYILYMWQIEDMIRANNLDIDRIKANVIDKFTDLTDAQRKEMTEWYESLIDMMRREGVAEKGHLQLNKNMIIQIEDLHRALLADPRFDTYTAQFYKALPFIVELRSKAGETPAGEIETCFNALYAMLLMRLQSKEVSPETQKAIAEITKFLVMLAGYFKLDDEDKLFNATDESDDSASAESN